MLGSERSIRRAIWLTAFALCAAALLVGALAVKVALERRTQRGRGRIVAQPGGDARCLCEAWRVTSVAWSPDSREVAVNLFDIDPWQSLRSLARGDRPPYRVFSRLSSRWEILDAESGRSRRIRTGYLPTVRSIGSWSKTGDLYLEAHETESSGERVETQIWRINVATGATSQVTRGPNDFRPRVSPDSRHLAFVRWDPAGSYLYVKPVSGARETRLAPVSRRAESYTWAGPHEIVFPAPSGRGPGMRRAGFALRVVDTRTGRVRSLLPGITVTTFCVEGRQVAFAQHVPGGVQVRGAYPHRSTYPQPDHSMRPEPVEGQRARVMGELARDTERLPDRTRLGTVDLDTGKVRFARGLQPSPVSSLRCGPGGSLVGVASPEETRGDLYQSKPVGPARRLTSFGDISGMSTSPNGRYAVFARREEAGKDSLWLMRLTQP